LVKKKKGRYFICMCVITIQITCPHCQSTNVVKNGRKKNGTQNFLCKSCRKQFQNSYQYNGADPRNKRLMLKMLSRNSGIRDIQEVLQVSRICILHHLLKEASLCQWTPKQTRYKSVQIDEHWSYVGSKKRKRWLIYAYAPETDEILAYVIGSRSAKTVRKLYQMLVKLQIDEYCTDDWKSFKQVFAKENHKQGKSFTRNIEGINNALRARNRRFVRKTTCFSKKDKYHKAAIKIIIQQRNSRHHTL